MKTKNIQIYLFIDLFIYLFIYLLIYVLTLFNVEIIVITNQYRPHPPYNKDSIQL